MAVLKKASFSKDKGRIVGLETEYVVSFVPSRKNPPKWLLLGGIEDAVLRQGRLCESSDGGYFLANGGALSFESNLERRDNPVIELATPECSDPWELLLYIRSQEVLLEKIASKVERFLCGHGYPGRVLFVRSNRDWNGELLGSHENYWIEWREAWPIALAGSMLSFAVSCLISFVNVIVALNAHVANQLVLFIKNKTRRRNRKRCSPKSWKAEPLANKKKKCRPLNPFYLAFRQKVLRAIIFFFEPVLEFFLIPRLSRELIPFLATRQIFAGSGSLQFGNNHLTPLHLSSRASSICSIAGISFGQRAKSIFDLKPFLRDPLSLLKKHKRLCISGGDSLMCETAVFLSFGTTSLVLAMLEGGESFKDLVLSTPLHSWRTVSKKGPHIGHTVKSGVKRYSAIEIQRIYLARAKKYFASSQAGSFPDQVIRLWEGVLQSLMDNPSSLWGQVDWVTKKRLMDPIVFSGSNWKDFSEWGAFFERLRSLIPRAIKLSHLNCLEAGRFFSPTDKLRFKRFLEDEEDFEKQRDIYLSCSKLELGYHEVSRHGGYFQKLRMSGEVVGLIDRKDAIRALTEPPPRTRANIRAKAIALADAPGDIEVSWDTIRINSSNLRVTIRDPLLHL